MLLLYNLFIQLILAPIKFGLRRYHIRQWENRIQLKKHLTTLDTISRPINGFELSRQAREHTDAYEYVYGEINSKSHRPFFMTWAVAQEKRCSLVLWCLM